MLSRRSALTGFTAAAAFASTRVAVAASPTAIRNVVLVHGAYADGSSWSEVIPILQHAGINVTAVQNPLMSLEDDCNYARRALALQDGATVLVAHSYGGEIITEAGVDPKVAALVYCAARAPDAGEDYAALAKKFPAPPASAGIVHSGGFARLNEAAFLRDFAGDVGPAKARALYAVQAPVSDTLFNAKVTQAAWRTKRSFYAVSTEDRTINPDLQRFMARRMGATTIEIPASHLAIISHPHEIASLILKAAQSASPA
jgi:pimeloyl-ACP methyl ester carboxylesterase